MMQIHCPVCHAAFPLEAALQHEQGREVMAMLAGMDPLLAQPLLHYLGFFRPAKQQLGWGRALRLMREVLALAETPVLVAGLVEASRSLDAKRALAGWKPLGNHNYLRSCMGSVQERGGVALALPPRPASRAGSRSSAGLIGLEEMRK